jgi:hypothetical protein
MTGGEYRSMMDRFGLDHAAAATFLDITERTSFRYAAQGSPRVIDLLFAVMIVNGLDVDDVIRIWRTVHKADK